MTMKRQSKKVGMSCPNENVPENADTGLQGGAPAPAPQGLAVADAMNIMQEEQL